MGTITPIIYDSYCAMIENSVGTKMFQNFYARKNKNKVDVIKSGQRSCAFFVSFILHNFNLIKKAHVTVDATLDDMKKSGWRQIQKPRKGAVIEWDKKQFSDKSIHKHIGFYMGKREAISTSSRYRKPIRHHITFGNKNSNTYRKIVSMYWHPKFN